jgi:CubicO group peptidase (beta-lactamase class C family)
MTSCAPAASRDVSWYPGNTLRWGLGFLLNEQQTPQGRSPGSLAWAGLPNHYYWIDRKRDVCGVFMGFLLPFSDARAMAGFWGWEKAVYQAVGTPA